MDRITDYLYAKAAANQIPIGATFELSPICNFSCKMCYVRKTPTEIAAEGKRLITWTEWLKLAQECKKEGLLYLLLTGGEPFLYPNFQELYMALHEMGIILSINTNGTMITRHTVEWLKKAAPSRINVTLYGASPETYKRICGQSDGYYRAVAAIDMLQEAGIPIVINGSMIPENKDDLEKIMVFGKERGINTRVATYMFPPARREKEITDSRFTPKEAAEMFIRRQQFQHQGKEWKEFLSSTLNMISDSEKFEEKDKNETWGTSAERMKCRAGRSSFWVSWDGRMTACGLTSFPVVQYPFEEDFKTCWKNLVKAVHTTPVLRECALCPKKEVCRPCVAMIQTETGAIDKKAPYLCEMTDFIINNMKTCLRAEEE